MGFAAVDGDWLEQLYVFARNARARRFYEAAGFLLLGEGDGSGNEEREPDCVYRWEGPASGGSWGTT